MKVLPQADVVGASAGQQAKLRVLAPILRYHDRETAIDITVLRARPAALAFLAGAAILITEPALAVLSAEELQAAVAHELGHEYLWGEFELARQQAHHAKLQELELRCDGIAVITLYRLKLNPASLIRTVRKLNRYNRHKETDPTAERFRPLALGVVLSAGAVACGSAPDSPTAPTATLAAPLGSQGLGSNASIRSAETTHG